MAKGVVKTIHVDDWYTTDEAVKQLSENSGRKIDRNYPRTLARYGKITSINLSDRVKLYWKKDIDEYKVATRGRKAGKSNT